MKKITLLILLVILALVACSSPPPPEPTRSPTIAVTPLFTENLPTPTVVTEIPYPYPHPTSAVPLIMPEFPTTDPLATARPPEPTETPEPLDLSGVWFAKLLNAQQGWAISDGNLLWTDDTGYHWREMTPLSAEEGVIQNAFFLDSQQAWVFVCDPQPQGDLIKISYTSDGGNLWGISEVTSMKDIEAFSPLSHWCGRLNLGHIFFLNAQQGWILVDHTTSHTHVGEIFQTLDGGQTWQHLGTSPSGEFFFVSGNTGWILADAFGPKPLYRTEDGGKTWQNVIVNGSDGDDDFYRPVFFDQPTGVLAMILRNQEIPAEGITFFKSQDGGLSWEPIGKLSSLPRESLGYGTNSVQIWDEQNWVVAAPGYGVNWTADGGQSWVENTSETARGLLGLTLGSATSAWGWMCDPNPNSNGRCIFLLMVTEDMGAHWEKVEVQP